MKEFGALTAKRKAISAVDSDYAEILTIDGPGYIILTSQDCYARWRLVTIHRDGGAETADHYETGPAGSKALHRINGPRVRVERQVVGLLAANEHADPATGIYTGGAKGAGVDRDSYVEAVRVLERPCTDQQVLIPYTSTSSEGQIDATDYTWGAWAPGWCRSFRLLMSKNATATVWADAPADDGAGANVTVLEETATPSGGGPVHPWLYTYIGNDHATVALDCAWVWSSDQE